MKKVLIIGAGGVGRFGVAGLGEEPADEVGVGDVHLAAVGLDVDLRAVGGLGQLLAVSPVAASDLHQLAHVGRCDYHAACCGAIIVCCAPDCRFDHRCRRVDNCDLAGEPRRRRRRRSI